MDANRKTDILEYIGKNLSASDYDIAKIVKYIYGNDYCMLTDNKQDKWFKFNGKHWETSTMIKHELKIKLSEEVSSLIADLRTKIRNNLSNLSSFERTYEENRMKTSTKIEQMLRSTNVKDKILRECESLFFVKDFPDRSNGVM